MSDQIYSRERLQDFVKQVFVKCGMDMPGATQASDVLLAADLRGIDSHGVARLSGYIRLWEKGRANFSPHWRIVHETPSTATVDADEGLGLVVAPAAMNIAIEKARNVGTGWVAIRNSNHFGIAAYHAMLALPHNMIGIAMTNASPLVAPARSKEKMLGTNPMCYVFPAGKYDPVVVDMATSSAANGKLEIAQRMGKPIPHGWVQNEEGSHSSDAAELAKGGALQPLGSANDAGHKGYALGAVVDILSAVLSGANYGPWVPPFVSFLDPLADLPGKGIGHFVGALRIDAFRPADEFRQHMDQWIERFRKAVPIEKDKPVLIPGDPEMETSRHRMQHGIPLNQKVVDDLKVLAAKFEVSL